MEESELESKGLQGDDASKGHFPSLGVSEILRCLYLFAGTRRIKDGKSCLTEALKESGGEAGDERGGY